MNSRTYVILVLLTLSALVGYACTKNESPDPGPPGKDKSGEPIIKLTPDLIYPGSAPFEDAVYEYLSSDPPEKVAKWFEDNLVGSIVERRNASIPTDTKWVITYNDLIIDVVYGPNQTDTLIRYKKDLSMK